MAYSIEAALRSRLFDRIIVSTDDREIADVALQWGAEIPFVRPSELADDFATTSAVIIHALDYLRENDILPNCFCCLYATAPFIHPEYLKKAYHDMIAAKAQSAFTVTTYAYPIFRAFHVNQSQQLERLWPEYRNTRSQDLPEVYHDAGQFYWASTEVYLKEQTFLTSTTLPIILPRYMVQDIDTPEDWTLAEAMFRVLSANQVK